MQSERYHAPNIEGLPAYKPPGETEAPWTRPEAVSAILANSGVQLRTGGDRAFYSPQFDFIQLPPDVAFPEPGYLNATEIHELNHATGHSTRVNRDLSGKLAQMPTPARKPRAEMGAAFVCNTLNLPTDFENHAAYVTGWLRNCARTNGELLSCAADARRIAEYTLA